RTGLAEIAEMGPSVPTHGDWLRRNGLARVSNIPALDQNSAVRVIHNKAPDRTHQIVVADALWLCAVNDNAAVAVDDVVSTHGATVVQFDSYATGARSRGDKIVNHRVVASLRRDDR